MILEGIKSFTSNIRILEIGIIYLMMIFIITFHLINLIILNNIQEYKNMKQKDFDFNALIKSLTLI